MPAINQENIENKDSTRNEKTTISVVGCGRIGILHACLLTEAGFRVICVDNDRALAERVSKGNVPFLKQEVEPILRRGLESGRLKVSCVLEGEAVQSGTILVTTPAMAIEKGRVDYSNIEKTLNRLGSRIQKDTLIIVASVVGVGVTESILKEALESASGFKVGVDFYFAYSPVPFPEEQTLKSLANRKRIIAACDKVSLERASNVVGAITKAALVKSLNLKAAEAAVLFEAAHRNVNLALAHEFALFCEKTGVDYLTVQSLLSSDINAFFQPTLNSGSGKDALCMLMEDAENQNVKLKISRASLELNKETIKHGVSLVQEALKSCGKSIRRAKIVILGISQTKNTADVPKGLLKDFVEMLEKKGAKPSFYDPYLTRKTRNHETAPVEESLTETMEGTDCIVIFTGHDQFKRLNLRKIKLLAKIPAAIVDLEGILDPAKVEAEGFIYRGLGRGVWKK
ncbi:MAG: nucleotide sugar dehydrogenase [Candidatus Bathyarchaeota archaeon]|nr:nucleotide sugar dehydrogenase [Candidatus Bathyarchaeota archaeon]MDW8040220.1 nucleotide sugar dehydrogenase [Nitrososphaerota archaeon]